MNHDEYWKKVMKHAEKTLCGLFDGGRTRVRDVVGDDNGIDDEKDVKAVLAYVLGHGDCSERACAILACCAWSQAVNAGFDAAHKVPVAELGIEIDATDAARFFDGL